MTADSGRHTHATYTRADPGRMPVHPLGQQANVEGTAAARRFAAEVERITNEFETEKALPRADAEARHLLATRTADVLDGTSLRCPYCDWSRPDIRQPRRWLAVHLASQHPDE